MWRGVDLIRTTTVRLPDSSSVDTIGHHPRHCLFLNRLIWGHPPSVASILRPHLLLFLEGRGNLFRSRVTEPEMFRNILLNYFNIKSMYSNSGIPALSQALVTGFVLLDKSRVLPRAGEAWLVREWKKKEENHRLQITLRYVGTWMKVNMEIWPYFKLVPEK